MKMPLGLIGICAWLVLVGAFEAKESTAFRPSPDVVWMKFDEYGGISSNKERLRLKRFVIELQDWKNSNAVIVAHAGHVSCKREAQVRASRVKNYLIQWGSIESNRITTIDAGYEEEWGIELFVGPQEARPLISDFIKEKHLGLKAERVQILGDCRRTVGRWH
jgi:hypothetical protein